MPMVLQVYNILAFFWVAFAIYTAFEDQLTYFSLHTGEIKRPLCTQWAWALISQGESYQKTLKNSTYRFPA